MVHSRHDRRNEGGDRRASGAGTLCVRFADGHIACWGANYGALGNGEMGPSMAAVPVVLP